MRGAEGRWDRWFRRPSAFSPAAPRAVSRPPWFPLRPYRSQILNALTSWGDCGTQVPFPG